MKTFVYLAESLDGSILKIGCSYDPFRRMESMYLRGKRVHTRLLYAFPGSMDLEHAIQNAFDRFRTFGAEWFSRSEEILKFFEDHQQPVVVEKRPRQSPSLRCRKCNWNWTQLRTSTNPPERCPNPDCRSKLWNKGQTKGPK